MKSTKTFLLTLAIMALSVTAAMAQSTYTITKVGTNFNAYKNGTPLLSSEPLLQNVIDAIKINAGGTDCIIQFGGGGAEVLDLGGGATTLITFTGNWGKITLTGKATTASTAASTVGIIRLEGDLLLESKADITATGSSACLFFVPNAGTLTISSGIVEATGSSSYAVRNESTGTVNITGGTVSGSSITVYCYTTGTINISGGTVESTTNMAAVTNNGTLNITGGTVQVTGTSGIAASTNSGTINISGGTVQATTECAVYIASNGGKANISGGTVSATTGRAISALNNNEITISGTALVTSANPTATGGTIRSGSGFSGLLKITGGTVENTANNGNAIRNEGTGTVEISGGTVLAPVGYGVWNNHTGELNISGGTTSALITIWNQSTGTVNISGGDIATTYGTAIWNNAAGTLNITGGTIQATDDDGGTAIFNHSGAVTINGGMVLAKPSSAIENFYAGTGTITLNGGIVFAYGANANNVISGTYTHLGNAVIVSWNKAAGTTAYLPGTSTDIFKLPAAATAVWAKQGSDNGISVTNGTNTGFIPIAGVTVSNHICQIGTSNYITLDAAIAAVPTDGTSQTVIKLLDNITHPNRVDIVNKKITFDLDGKNLIIANYLVYFNSVVNYTGTGEFKVIRSVNDTGNYSGNYGLEVYNSSCTLTGVEITDNGTGTNRGVRAIFSNYSTVVVNGDVKATSNGGTGSSAIGILAHSSSTATVKGNVISSETGVWVQSGGTVTVDGYITAQPSTYLNVGGLATDYRTISDFDTPTTKPGYLTYAKGTNTVWVKESGSGINEIINGKLQIYPNPVKDQLTIKSEEISIERVEICDMSGKTLLSFPSLVSPATTITLSHLPSGTYFVKLTTDKGELTKKVIKE